MPFYHGIVTTWHHIIFLVSILGISSSINPYQIWSNNNEFRTKNFSSLTLILKDWKNIMDLSGNPPLRWTWFFNIKIYQSCQRHSWLLQAKVLSAPPMQLMDPILHGHSMLWSEDIAQHIQDITQHTKDILPHLGHCATNPGNCATLRTLHNTSRILLTYLGHCATHLGHCATHPDHCTTHPGHCTTYIAQHTQDKS